jgi:hypothetical protein
MLGAARMHRDDVLQRAAALHAAVDQACRGRAERADWRLIFDAVNVAEQLVMHRVASGLDAVQDVQAQIMRIHDRQKARGTKALYAEEVQTLRAFAADYAEILSGVSNAEYFAAQAGVEARVRRVLAGERIPASMHVVEAA